MDNFDDNFTYAGKFKGELPEKLTKESFAKLVEEHGQAWANGYLAAMKMNVIEISNILMPADSVGGIPQTTHKVRTNLKNYWSHNKLLIINLTRQIEPFPDSSNKLEP